MAQQFFLVPDRLGRYHEAKTMVNAAGNDVINPNTGNPFVVPRDFDVNIGIAFGTTLDPNRVVGPTINAGPYISRAIQLYNAVKAGGFLDIQRNYNEVVNGGGDEFVPAFTDAASFYYGLMARAAGYGLAEVQAGGGLYNLRQRLFNDQIEVSGPYGNNPRNALSMEAGVAAYEQGWFTQQVEGVIPYGQHGNVITLAVDGDLFAAAYGRAFTGALGDVDQLLTGVATGQLPARGDLVQTTNNDQFWAPFAAEFNHPIVIAAGEDGATISIVHNNFLEHITALPVDGTRIDTAFAPDGGRIVTTTDLPDFHGWDREIKATHPDGLFDKILVNDDGTVAQTTWNGAALAGDFGQMFGSKLGQLIGGNTLVGKLAAGTVMGAIGKEVGNALFAGANFQLDTVVNNAFGTLAGGTGIGSLPAGAIGAISTLLMSELADAVDLHGFEGGLFQTAGTTITTRLITNAYGVMTGATVNGLPNGELYTMFTGFDTGAIFLQLEGAIAGYLGTTLAAHLVMPHRAEGAIGQQIGTTGHACRGTTGRRRQGKFSQRAAAKAERGRGARRSHPWQRTIAPTGPTHKSAAARRYRKSYALNMWIA